MELIVHMVPIVMWWNKILEEFKKLRKKQNAKEWDNV
jgi:hypothetical protein